MDEVVPSLSVGVAVAQALRRGRLDQHVRTIDELDQPSSVLRLAGLEGDDALARVVVGEGCSTSEGAHRRPARRLDQHHVGAQLPQQTPCVRRERAVELDHPQPGQRVDAARARRHAVRQSPACSMACARR